MRNEKISNINRGLGLTAVGAAVAAGLVFGYLGRRRKKFEFRGKTVLITGGSRGLGLVIARELVREGARVAICAGDEEELRRAREDLGVGVVTFVCDVTSREQVENTVRDFVTYFGRIDVLINNAGIIQAGPLEAQTEKDFRDAMNTHFWGPYYTMQAVAPHMKIQKNGRIANISSIGGKVAVPHLTPYCASKFALAGLSSGMRAELAKDGVTVTTVYPGLMRTGSHINAEFKGKNKLEFALFSLVDAFPLASIRAEKAAKQILDAVRCGKAETVLSIPAQLAAKFSALFPDTTSDVLSLVNQLLPSAEGGTRETVSGLESSSAISPSILTSNIDEASRRNNELTPAEAREF